MDLFDFSQILDLAKIEPGHGLVQSALLLMIWLSSRGVRKEVVSLKEAITHLEFGIELRFQKIENRVTDLETHKGESK